MKKQKFDKVKPKTKLIDSENKPTEVLSESEEHFPTEMFEITMQDGAKIEVSGNHLWYCENNDDRLFKDEYKKQAKDFLNFINLEELEKIKNIEYTVEQIVIFLEYNNIDFILKMLDSIGISSECPYNIEYNGLTIPMGKIGLYKWEQVLYAIKCLQKAINNEGYLYFGKVRETREIVEMIEKGDSINIPTIHEIKGKKEKI